MSFLLTAKTLRVCLKITSQFHLLTAYYVIPAQAGNHCPWWIPTFVGMTASRVSKQGSYFQTVPNPDIS